LIVNLLDAKLAQPNHDFFTLHHLQDRSCGPYRTHRPRLCGKGRSGLRDRTVGDIGFGPQSRDNFSRVHKLNALKRGVDVEQIVEALRFIIATPTLTGQTITLDAGQRFLSLPRDVQFLEPDNE
jgi:hypothetical protein